jgi:hypothetical protein
MLLLFGCGGGGGGSGDGGNNNDNGSTNNKIRGSMTGLQPSETVVMNLKAGPVDSDLSVSANGEFTFPQSVPSGQSYVVTIKTPPPGRSCPVRNGTGVVGDGDVTNLLVSCLTISGSASELNGVLHLNLSIDGAAPITLRIDDDAVCTFDPITGTGSCPFGTSFGFPAGLAPGQTYAVTVASHPIGQACTITNGTGTMGSTRVSNIGVSCSNTGAPIPTYFSVGGSASGTLGRLFLQMAVDGQSLAGDLVVDTTGAFTFPQRMLSGQSYTVTIRLRQGPDDTCSLLNGSGVIGSANVTNVSIVCPTTIFRLGGSVSGLGADDAAILRLTADGGVSEDLFLLDNGTFNFQTGLTSGQSYTVALIPPQPPGKTCTLSNGSGVMGPADVTNLSVSCTAVVNVLSCPASDGAGVGGLHFTGTVTHSGLTLIGSATVPSVSLTYGVTYSNPALPSSSVTAPLRINLWAVSASFDGSTSPFATGGYWVAAVTPNFTGIGAASADQVKNFSTIPTATRSTMGFMPPSGTYCLVMTLDERANGCLETQCAPRDFVQFSGSVTFQ